MAVRPRRTDYLGNLPDRGNPGFEKEITRACSPHLYIVKMKKAVNP